MNRIANYFAQGRTTVDAAPERPKNQLWIWYFATLIVLTITAVTVLIVYNLGQQLKPEQLAAAEALWKAKGPRDYDLTYQQKVAGGTETYTVRVRGGKVESVERNGEPMEERHRINHSMKALFSFINRFQEIDAEPGRPRAYKVAKFDEHDGHLLRYVRNVMATHERAEITVTSLTVPSPQ